MGKSRRLRLFKKPTNKQIGHLLQYGHKMTMIKLNLCWKKLTVVSRKSTDNWNLYKQVWTLCTAWATLTENKLAAWKLRRLNALTQPMMWDANNTSYCTLRGNGALGRDAVYHNPFFMMPSEVMQPVYTMTPHSPVHLWNHKVNFHKRNIGKLLSLWSKHVQMEPSWETSWAILCLHMWMNKLLSANLSYVDSLIPWSPDPD